MMEIFKPIFKIYFLFFLMCSISICVSAIYVMAAAPPYYGHDANVGIHTQTFEGGLDYLSEETFAAGGEYAEYISSLDNWVDNYELNISWCNFTLTIETLIGWDRDHYYIASVGVYVTPEELITSNASTEAMNNAPVEAWADYFGVPTRVRVNYISFVTIDPDTDMPAGVCMVHGPNETYILDTGWSTEPEYASGNINVGSITPQRTKYVPNDVAIIINYSVGVPGPAGSDIQSIWPVAGVELPNFIYFPLEVSQNAPPEGQSRVYGWVYNAETNDVVPNAHLKLWRGRGVNDVDDSYGALSDELGRFDFRNFNNSQPHIFYINLINDGGIENGTTVSIVYNGQTQGVFFKKAYWTQVIHPREIWPVFLYLESKPLPDAIIEKVENSAEIFPDEMPTNPNFCIDEDRLVHFEGTVHFPIPNTHWAMSYAEWYHSERSEPLSEGNWPASSEFTVRWNSNLVPNPSENCTVFLKVKDVWGDWSLPGYANIRVNHRPRTEVVSIEPNPARRGEPITFHIDATDDDGYITEYRSWLGRIRDEQGVDISNVTWRPAYDYIGYEEGGSYFTKTEYYDCGTYALRVKAKDDLGAWSSDPDTPGLGDLYGEDEDETRDFSATGYFTVMEEPTPTPEEEVETTEEEEPAPSEETPPLPKPDLVITALWHEPTELMVAEEATIYAVVRNQGTRTASFVKVKFMDDQVLYYPHASHVASPLAAGAQMTTHCHWTPTYAGSNILITAFADYLDEIIESDDSNNSRGLGVSVFPSAGGLDAITVSTPPKPDFTFTRLWVEPNPPTAGQQAMIYANVVNAGNSWVSSFPRTKFVLGSANTTTTLLFPPPNCYVPPLFPGYGFRAFAEWTPDALAENFPVLAVVDYPPCQVDESNELNNTMEIRIDILPAEEEPTEAEEGPELAPEERSGADLELLSGTLEFSAPAFKVGKEIKIAVKVKNKGIKKLAPVEVEFWANEEKIGEDKIGGLNSGEKKRFTIFWTPRTAGRYTIYAIADPYKRFDETDEGNNRDERIITIEE